MLIYLQQTCKVNLLIPLWNTIKLTVLSCHFNSIWWYFCFLVARTNLKFKQYLSSIFIFPYIYPWTLELYGKSLIVMLLREQQMAY